MPANSWRAIGCGIIEYLFGEPASVVIAGAKKKHGFHFC
jgi:hypothetical protein